jgi:hypothetical protein
MENFNQPGSNKTKLDEESKKFVIDLQLQNIVNILGAKVERCRVYDSDNRDKVSHKITITYNV